MNTKCLSFAIKLVIVGFTFSAFNIVALASPETTSRVCSNSSVVSKSIHTYTLDINQVLFRTNERFLSFSIDSLEIKRGLHSPSLRNTTLINIVSHLSPGYLRIGGIQADCLIFKEENSLPNSEEILDPNNTFLMTDSNWMDINEFANKTGLKVLFDLNVLRRKNNHWEPSNAQRLLDYSADNSLMVDWQLGNEPNAFLHNFNVSISPLQLAKDFATLRDLLDSYAMYKGAQLVGPDVTSPHSHIHPDLEILPERFLQNFTSSGGDTVVDAITWHHYYLHSNSTLADFLSTSVFDSLLSAINSVKHAVRGFRRPIWITESGSASGGGVQGASDRFIASLLFLDRLGVAAAHGVDVVVRQSIYSSHYSLLMRATLTPNPDWWVSYIYKQLVGRTVLTIYPSDSDDDTLRLYAHCSHNGSVVVFGVNLSNKTEELLIQANTSTAHFYLLTAYHLTSRKVKLNGEVLRLRNDSPPPLQPLIIDARSPFMVAAHSIFFIHFIELFSENCSV